MDPVLIESVQGLLVYVGALLGAGLIEKYVFKVSPAVLAPSVGFLIIYVMSLIISPKTRGMDEANLSYFWYGLTLLALVGGLFVCFKYGIPVRHIFWSLLFQIPYCFYLYYYGGIILLHKFDA